MKKLLVGISLALSMVMASGCGEDVSAQLAAWNALKDGSMERIAGFRGQLETLTETFGGLPSFEGFEGLAARRTALEGKITALRELISGAEGTLTSQGEAMMAALAKKKIADANTAMSSAEGAIDGAMSSITESIADITSDSEQMTSLGALVTSITEVQGRAAGEHLATTAGVHDFLDIDFQSNSAEFDMASENTGPALERLVALASACDESRFSIHGHASKEGNAERNQTLSEQRAQAIRAYLLTHDVEEEQITGTVGHGSADSAVAEPEPESAEATAMDAGLLEAIRNVNRRVSINIETACPAA